MPKLPISRTAPSVARRAIGRSERRAQDNSVYRMPARDPGDGAPEAPGARRSRNPAPPRDAASCSRLRGAPLSMKMAHVATA